MRLPTDVGVVFIGSCLRDPGEGPWGVGALVHDASLPPGQVPVPFRVASHAGRTAGLSAPGTPGATSTSIGTAEPERQGRAGTAPATTGGTR